jgi:hypothetical protein
MDLKVIWLCTGIYFTLCIYFLIILLYVTVLISRNFFYKVKDLLEKISQSFLK